MVQPIITLILNFIYLFSFITTAALVIVLINSLFLFFSYEDNIYFSSDDYLEVKIDRFDHVYEELFEFDINQYEFYADEVSDAELENPEPHLLTTARKNNFDEFHGYFNSSSTPTITYLELLNTTKLFFSNEILILFFIVFIYNVISFLPLIITFFLASYIALFVQYNNLFSYKKFINLNSTLKSEKGYLEYSYTQLDTTNKAVELTEFIGSADHFLLTQQTKSPLRNYSNYYVNDFEKKNLLLLLNNNLDLNFNYLVKFISSKESTSLVLNKHLTNFLIYYNINLEWKQNLPELLKFENSDEQNKFESQLPKLTTNEFASFSVELLDKQLIFSKNNFLIVKPGWKKDKLKLNTPIKYLVDSSTESLKGDYSNFYNCYSDSSFDDFFNCFSIFLNLNNVSFYLQKSSTVTEYEPGVALPNSFFKTNYLFKNKFDTLFYFNNFRYTKPVLYRNDYFNFFSIVNLYTNTTLKLDPDKKINLTILENFINFDDQKLTDIWLTLLTNSENLIKLVKLNVTYRLELNQILNYPFHNKFYLKLLNSDPLQLKIYECLFSSSVPEFIAINFNTNLNLDTNIIIKKNKQLKQTFKKFFKFNFLFKSKRKKLNKSFFKKKKFFYYFWVQIVKQLKKLFNYEFKKVAFDYLFFDKRFLNFFNLTPKSNLTKLNIVLAVFLSSTDCFYTALNNNNASFYYNCILSNNYYQKLKLNYLNFDNWVDFFNSVDVSKLAQFLNLPENKLGSVNNFNLSSFTVQPGTIFLNYCNAKSIKFSKLFFLKNLYKKLFFENNFYKFDEINNFADYFFYIKRIFLLIFKFEFRSALTYVVYSSQFSTKLNYQFKQSKKVSLVKSYLLKAQSPKNILVPNDYTAALLNTLLTDNNFMFNNLYNSIINYTIFSDESVVNLDHQIKTSLLIKLNINLLLSTKVIKLRNLINKLSLVELITVLSYITGPKVKLLSFETFYSDNITNPDSVAYTSFIWVDNEEDLLSSIPEDGILLEDHSFDNDFDDEGYAELGSVDFSLELDADLVEDNFKKSLGNDYGYVNFFPYKIKDFTERFLFFDYFKRFITFKNLKLYLSYHPNWFYLIFNFIKIIIITVFKNLYHLFGYKIFLISILLITTIFFF